MARIIDIEGIGPKHKRLLKEKASISTTEALLKASATPRQRKELAATTGISPKLILEWANLGGSRGRVLRLVGRGRRRHRCGTGKPQSGEPVRSPKRGERSQETRSPSARP